ncbi:hypothetical protein MVEG_06051 [Podila verticillata NRRL 6337]|nr:hypothetical protein MVEG_06051 [Podila verticillata NRRL 6337]
MSRNQQYQRRHDEDETDDYDFDHSSSYAMTPQQQRQEERKRHADMATASGTNPYGAKSNKKSKKCKVIGWSTLVILLLAIGGVLAWYFAVFKKNENKKNDSARGTGGGTIAVGPTVVSPNGTVVPNVNYPLKRVFYGMAYVPMNAQMPNCLNTQASVDEELQLVVQTTKRVRLYGTDCSVLRFTMDSIKRLKLDLKVVVGIWIDADNATYTRQRDEFFSVVSTYGWENIIGVSVGNEVIFDGYQPLETLLAHIKEVKNRMVAMGQTTIPVFTSDLEKANQPPLTSDGNEDLAGANIHPFFSGVPVAEAAAWFWKYLEKGVKPDVNRNNTTPLDVWVTEVGWPTFPATANRNSSIPSIPNLQTFIDTWVCEANKQGLPYYYFEFFDAPWKIWPGSPVEGFWGILSIDKKLKVKLPDCLIA